MKKLRKQNSKQKSKTGNDQMQDEETNELVEAEERRWQDSNDEARTMWEATRSMPVHTQDAEAQCNLGQLHHYELDNPQIALRHYNKAIRNNPNYCEAYFHRAELHKSMDSYENSLKDYETCIRLNGNDAMTWNNKGHLLHYMLEDYDTAYSDYTTAIALDDGYGVAYLNRGCLGITMGDYESALQDLDCAADIDATDDLTFYYRAKLTFEQYDDYESAMNDLDHAIEVNPQSVEAFQLRAEIKELLGDDTSVEDLQTAMALQRSQ
eukprot:TRINITY_DN49929_c0_g2_i1.p1 TRINITY_DN49929_c0_g2~~TRINITY_DN49929_c0_g2_i1.p1  ORF type:complete len:292 (-),score=31.58 TRINITY_DN49929_c0_g2_i1:109-906(-)